MKNKISIAGLSIKINFCSKINDKPIKSNLIAKEPLTTINDSDQDNTYIVDIITHIPNTINVLEPTNLNSGIYLNDNKSLYLAYNGVRGINTSVMKSDVLLCRNFTVEYLNKEPLVEKYDLYHIQFNYSILMKNLQSAEAILVTLTNEDPETSRGTVTAVRGKDD